MTLLVALEFFDLFLGFKAFGFFFLARLACLLARFFKRIGRGLKISCLSHKERLIKKARDSFVVNGSMLATKALMQWY